MNRRRSYATRVLIAVGMIVCAWGLCADPSYGTPPDPWDDLDFGWIWSVDETTTGTLRRRALGPFLERQEAGPLTFRAVRPWYSCTDNQESGRILHEYLWPVGMRRSRGEDAFARYLFFFQHDFQQSSPTGRYRSVLFPLACWGRSVQGQSYGGVFPLGGRVREFLGMDQIDFFLFPLYGHVRDVGIESHHVLWPIYARVRGPGVRRDRVFPLYGKSWREDQWTKRFVLWPIWSSVRYEYPDQTGNGFVLFPLVGRVNLNDQKGWMVLPPFFRWSRSDTQVDVNAPWPFIRYGTGDVNRFHVWPLFGWRETALEKSAFFVWPIGYAQTQQKARDVVEHRRLFPLIYHKTVRPRVESGVTEPDPTERFEQLWPLASYERRGEERRIRAPVLWPLPCPGGLERNWAPLWTLYDRTWTTNQLDESWLWGVYRRRASGNSRSWSIFPLYRSRQSDEQRAWSFLLGLAGYEREGLRRTYRFLYLFRHTRMSKPAGPEIPEDVLFKVEFSSRRIPTGVGGVAP